MIDITTGKQKRILANLVEDNKEITVMKFLQSEDKETDIKINGKMIIGDSTGNMSTYSFLTGKKYS